MICDELLIFIFLAIVVYLVCFLQPHIIETNDLEGFFGGYYYPYDYPYYWPYFYSGCNQTMFGDIKCLPLTYNPFW